jgi:ADP-ribosylglycohydrolase
MRVTKDKVVGMFLGTMIGDTLGKPVEMWKADKIKEVHGRLTEIVDPSGHKFFQGQRAGTWTDDTQLTVAVAQAMVQGGGLNMDAQKEFHVKALLDNTDGWGGSTREAVRRMANGAHWSASGQGDDGGKGKGLGNGVPMKIGPLGAYLAMTSSLYNYLDDLENVVDFGVKLSRMTHLPSISAQAGAAQMMAVNYCLEETPETFDDKEFVFEALLGSSMARAAWNKMGYAPSTDQDDISTRLLALYGHAGFDTTRIIEEFKGSCYCYDSVPFTLMFFVKNPHSIESLYDVVNAGGDTDSNGSMLAALLGSLHGTSVFPQHLVDKLDPAQKETVLETAEKFYEKFANKE